MRLEKAIMLNISTRLKPLFLLLSCALLWQGCNIINPHEPTPTYVHIDSFAFEANPVVTLHDYFKGDPTTILAPTSHYITSAWVYYNENPIGIFDLPVTLPIIANGTSSLKIAPALPLDGRNNDVAVYPFYIFDTSTLVAQPGKIINYTPKTEFYSAAVVRTIDNFNEAAINFDLREGNQLIKAISDNSQSFDGSKFGEIQLLAVGDSSIDSTRYAFPIPEGIAFIEFDYKSTVPFYVGLQANLSKTISSAPFYLSGINPNTAWQKFYLKVDGFTGQAQTGTYDPNIKYNFYIKAVLADGQTSGQLLIDNIQLVTF